MAGRSSRSANASLEEMMGSFSEIVRAKLAAGAFPVIQTFPPLVTVTGKAEDRIPRSALRRKARENLTPSLPPLGLMLEEVAAYIGVSPNKYKELERRGLMPAPRVIDGRRVHDRELAH